ALSSCVVRVCADSLITLLHALSLHDALPIYAAGAATSSAAARRAGGRHDRRRNRIHRRAVQVAGPQALAGGGRARHGLRRLHCRSEEHTSELQSRENLVCRLLLEKKNKNNIK